MIIYRISCIPAFLAVSLLMSNAFKFRWWYKSGRANCIYCLWIFHHSMPVVVANAILMVIIIYQIIQLYKSKEAFDVIPVESEPLANNLSETREEILEYFPQFEINRTSGFTNCVFRDMTAANIFIADVFQEILLYTTVRFRLYHSKYRDYKVGKFLFELRRFLNQKRIKKITYKNLTYMPDIFAL